MFVVPVFSEQESKFVSEQTSFIRDATPEDIPAVYGMVVELEGQKEAIATNCIFMEWNVFAWNEPAIALFVKKLGGELRRELIPVKLKGPEIQKLADRAR